MIVSVPREGYTDDLLLVGKLPWPPTLPMAVDNGIDLTMHGGKLSGRLVITAEDADRPGWWRATWTCLGSRYDGREFLIAEGAHTELAAPGKVGMVASPYRLARV